MDKTSKIKMIENDFYSNLNISLHHFKKQKQRYTIDRKAKKINSLNLLNIQNNIENKEKTMFTANSITNLNSM